MKRLEVSGAVRPIYGSLGVKRLMYICLIFIILHKNGSSTVSKVKYNVTVPPRYECLRACPFPSGFPTSILLALVISYNICILSYLVSITSSNVQSNVTCLTNIFIYLGLLVSIHYGIIIRPW